MSETASDGDNEVVSNHRKELSEMKKMLMETKVGEGNKSVWTTTLETFGMADGKHKKNDVWIDTVQDGLELLNDYVSQLEENKSMNLVPLGEFNATQDQFLTAFLKWAEKDSNDKASSNKTINVSKARRRLDAYFEWMSDNAKDFEEPLTVESIAPAAKIWDIQVTYDEKGHFLWWIDLGALNKAAIKKLLPRDHLRYVVWFSHFVMLDKKAQDNGAMIIEDLGFIGFFKMATLVPTELSAKMDRLTIGILPVRLKAIYVFGAASWMNLLMMLMKPFMGKKMRDRMILMPKKTDMQTFCDELVARKNIPVNFCGLKGLARRDMMFETDI